MKGYSFRSLTELVLKIFKTKIVAGTGLSGGGSLESDRTLTVSYGTTAGTAAQGNDSRVVNAASNDTVNAKEAALEAKKADKATTITAGTGLSGGGTLAANRTLTVSYGTAAGTAAQGNDSRITGALQSSQVVQTTGTSTTSVMSQKAATDQLATKAALSHTHPWSQVTGRPAQATRWPTFAEVTGKPTYYPTTWASVAAQPATATRWPTWAEVTSKPVVQTVGTSTTDLMSQKAVTDLFGQPTMTGVAVTNGTDNSLTLTNIVTVLGLEKGDVIQISGSVSGLNNKLFSIDGIASVSKVIVNYVHAGNHGNGPLKLVNQNTSITIKRIAKWYNAPLGLGQAWINLTGKRATGFSHGNVTGRPIMVMVSTSGMTAGDMVLYSGEILLARTSSAGGAGGSISGVIPAGQNYAIAAPGSDPHWVELC